MRKFLLPVALFVVGFLCLAGNRAESFYGMPPMLGIASGPSSAYQGPIDAAGVSGSIYFGLRAPSAATRGDAAVLLCTPSDASCETEYTDATTGNLDLGPVGATCSNSSPICTIKELFDPLGGCNLTQATIADRATFILAAQGTRPGMLFTAGSTIYTQGGCTWITAPGGSWTMMMQLQTTPTSVPSVSGWFVSYGNQGSSGRILFNGINQSTLDINVGFYAYNETTTIVASGPNSIMYGYDGTYSYASQGGGSIYSVSNAVEDLSGTLTMYLGNFDRGTSTWEAGELVFWPSYLGSTVISNVNTNMAAYW